MGGKAAIKRVGCAQSNAAEAEIAPDSPRASVQKPGCADIGKQPDRGLRHREQGALRRHPVGAVDRDPGAAAHRDAVDDRDVWFRKMVDGADQPVFLAEEHRSQARIAGDPAAGLVDRADIAAGAEGTAAGAADDDGMHRWILGPCRQRRGDPPVVRQGQRVQRLRPVDRQGGEPAGTAEQDLAGVTHSTGRAGGGR